MACMAVHTRRKARATRLANDDKGRRPYRWRPTSEMMMSDEPFLPPPAFLMSAVMARDLARECQGMANHLRERGDGGTARILERRSAWWMVYADKIDGKHDD